MLSRLLKLLLLLIVVEGLGAAFGAVGAMVSVSALLGTIRSSHSNRLDSLLRESARSATAGRSIPNKFAVAF